MDESFWDERYRCHDALWSGEPNLQLVNETAGLDPGTALDVGCGEGADAIWLAENGWRVTGVDISNVALHRAQAHAIRSGSGIADGITWLHVDLTEYSPDAASFNLVSAQFMHILAAQRARLHRRLADSVAPGGTLLIVGHDPSDLQTSIGRPPIPEFFPTATEVAAPLPSAAWRILVAEARPRSATDPTGVPVTIHDAVMKAQRRVASD